MKISRHKIPLAAKLAITAFLSVMIPIYLHAYGPTNFLWFCDAALILTAVGMWLESPLLISMCAVGILVPQCLWLVDFGVNAIGFHLLNMTSYMFDSHLTLFTRGLSLFHGWLPLLLVWLLMRVGYDPRGLWAWSVVAFALLLGCYFLALPPGAPVSDPNIPTNINYAFGFSDKKPQTWMNPHLYLLLWFATLWFVAYFPTHLVLRKIFHEKNLR